MAAPSTRTLDHDQVRDLRAHRRAYGGYVVFCTCTTLFCRVNEHGLVEISSAICGANDDFDPEMGELLARKRWSDGYFITVDEDAANAIMGTFV